MAFPHNIPLLIRQDNEAKQVMNDCIKEEEDLCRQDNPSPKAVALAKLKSRIALMNFLETRTYLIRAQKEGQQPCFTTNSS